ncbi:Mitochondrial distribution and morphology protein 12, partial [Oleoguttula sp. CCFEE 5521]
MAPEPPSPSASSILLPLLGGTSSRRSSLVSITSRKEIDKDALSQALDHIHITASRSETLTSFHDYDGRAPGSKSGPKELVSNGVSGLYNRLKQSVGGGSPVKDSKRPDSSSSVSTQSTAPIINAVPSYRGDGRLAREPKPQQIHKAADVPSVLTSAKVKPPLTPTFAANAQDTVPSPKGVAPDRADPQQPRAEQWDDEGAAADRTSSDVVRLSQDLASSWDRDRVRDAIRNDDRSESATHALARVLSHHEPQSAQSKTTIPGMLVISDIDREDDVSDKPDELDNGVPNKLPVMDAFGVPERRPPMIRVGVSHLPGFDQSRTPSPSRVPDVSSSNSSQVGRGAPSLEPSANLNTGLQRKRTGLRSHAASHSVQPIVPANLRRRVISKEFWMKDVNAKVCFNCGEGFSTFRRKHHCRTCGQIFDAKCTSLVEGRPFGQSGTLRLCKPCEEIILGDADDDSSELSEDGNESIRTPITRRFAITEGTSPTRLDGMSHSLPDGKGMNTPSIGIPASRRNREAKRRSAIIEFDTHPSLARPSSSRSLMSLAARPRSSSHRRHNSRHQLMRPHDDRAPFHQDAAGDPEKRTPLPAFHNDNIIDPDLAPYLSDEDSEGEGELQSLFAAISSDGRGTSPADHDKHGLGGFFAAAVRRSKSKLGERGTATSSVKGVRDDDLTSVSNKHGARLLKRRNPSISSINMQRPSPRHSRSKTLLRTMEHEPQEDPPSSPVQGPSSVAARFVRSSAMH